MTYKSLSAAGSSSLDPKVLSFSGDICEDGTITVIFILIAVVAIILVRIALTSASNRNITKAPAVKVNRMTQNHFLEEIFVLPFVPTSLENFVAGIYFAWFCMTITMGITRYFDGRWGEYVLTQQGLPNTIATFLGCKALPMDVVPYQWPTPKASSRRGLFGKRKTPLEILCEKNPAECSSDIDFYFSHHLFFGLVWLTLGAVQIYLARKGWSDDEKVRRKAHKLFGMFVALPAFFCHICMVCTIAWRNPVNQTFFISMQYWAMIFESVMLAMNGVWYVLESNSDPAKKAKAHGMHMVRMFFCWILSVAGSGSIRISAWFLWLVGKFFPMDLRILIDRGACQAMAFQGYPQWGIPPTDVGSAEYCFKAVFLNLACTDAVIIWLEWIFLCLPIASWDKNDREATIAKFKMMAVLSVLYLLMVFVFQTKDWVIKAIVAVWAFAVKIHTFRMYVASFRDDALVGGDDNMLAAFVDGQQETNLSILQRGAKKVLLKMYMIRPIDEAGPAPMMAAEEVGNGDDAANNHLHEE